MSSDEKRKPRTGLPAKDGGATVNRKNGGVLAGLTSDKADVRKKALAELKKLGRDEAITMLVDLLGDKNDDVQADLTRALLAYKDAALPPLVRALEDPSWRLRYAASRVIGAMGDSVLSRFLELIPRNTEDVDYWMVQILSLMGGEALHYLIRAFKHQNHKVKVAAVRAAGNVSDPLIVPALLHLLEDEAWPVRKAAYDSLEVVGHLNHKAIVDALSAAPHEAKFWVIKLASEREDPKLAKVFCEIVDRDPEECKIEAIRALGQIDVPEVRKMLVGFLSHKSWIIRKTAAETIFQQGHGISEELLNATRGSNVDARYWSVKLLGQVNEPRTFNLLLERLQDPDSAVRAAACQALGTLGDKRAAAPLMAMMADSAEDVRNGAMLAIGQLGEKDERRPSIPTHLRAENQMPCPGCGKSVGRTFTFCPFCLGHLKKACSKCGRAIEPEWKGCPDCGKMI